MEPKSIQFLEKMLEISRSMAANRDLGSLLQYALKTAMQLVNARQGHLILVGQDGSLDFQVIYGESDEVSRTIVDQVMVSQQPILIEDAQENDDLDDVSSVRDFMLRSIMCVPLISQNQLLGVVYVENRTFPNVFEASHLGILTFFAKQAAVLIDNAVMNNSLQRLREELINTREEERRRMRRDLHDGLGPYLAALRMELQAARNLSADDPQQSLALLEDVKTGIDDILDTVRQIVYELRPPALDELGLISGIREFISTYDRSSGIQFSVNVPQPFPPLSAAVEVAAYRIVLEAVTNVARHSQATQCAIRFFSNRVLRIEIEDNGVGLPPQVKRGVGLSSMQERVNELGGRLYVDSDKGTRIIATLPLLVD